MLSWYNVVRPGIVRMHKTFCRLCWFCTAMTGLLSPGGEEIPGRRGSRGGAAAAAEVLALAGAPGAAVLAGAAAGAAAGAGAGGGACCGCAGGAAAAAEVLAAAAAPRAAVLAGAGAGAAGCCGCGWSRGASGRVPRREAGILDLRSSGGELKRCFWDVTEAWRVSRRIHRSGQPQGVGEPRLNLDAKTTRSVIHR